MIITRTNFLSAFATTALTALCPELVTIPNALILGGFLMPESAYQPHVEALLGRFDAKVLTDKKLQLVQDEIDCIGSRNLKLVIGHSKGAKAAARWMASTNDPIACCLMEPVDVDPPNSPHESILDIWEKNPRKVANKPTLIISAPYTDTSKKYGKAKNLCAPEGKDAAAYYGAAQHARSICKDSAATLVFCEFPKMGHNDVAETFMGGCADGPDRSIGAQLTALVISHWSTYFLKETTEESIHLLKEQVLNTFPGAQMNLLVYK